MRDLKLIVKCGAVALVASTLLVLSACSSVGVGVGYSPNRAAYYAPSANVVHMANFAYSPKKIVINQGDRVTWVNNDRVSYTVTSNSGLFNSGNIAPGQAYTTAFLQKGIYYYHCQFHPNMKGVVVVR